MDHSNPIKKFAKIGLNQFQRVQVAIARMFGLVDFPVPANSSMRKTSSKKVKHFEVVNVIEGIIDFRQDRVILKRKPDL